MYAKYVQRAASVISSVAHVNIHARGTAAWFDGAPLEASIKRILAYRPLSRLSLCVCVPALDSLRKRCIETNRIETNLIQTNAHAHTDVSRVSDRLVA